MQPFDDRCALYEGQLMRFKLQTQPESLQSLVNSCECQKLIEEILSWQVKIDSDRELLVDISLYGELTALYFSLNCCRKKVVGRQRDIKQHWHKP